MDDILITGSSRESHDSNLIALFEKISECGVRIKMDKCSFLQEEIQFLGYMVSLLLFITGYNL